MARVRADTDVVVASTVEFFMLLEILTMATDGANCIYRCMARFRLI